MRFAPLGAVLVALALASGSPAAQAITHGTDDGVIHPSVGALLGGQAYNDGTWTYCTGTLVSPKVLVTAAHCGQPKQKTAMVSFSSRYRLGDSVYVGRYVPDPKYTDKSDGHDIAVVVFDTAIPNVKPARLPTAGLLDAMAANGSLAKTSFTPVGFGAVAPVTGTHNKTFRYTDTRRKAAMAYRSLTPTWLELAEDPALGNGGTCYGDSGGPNFLGGSDVLAATTISGDDDACKAANSDYRLDTPVARAFLGRFVTLP